MIKQSYFRLLSLMSFILIAGTFISCDKDDDKVSSKTELFSFGPTGTKHGDTLQFIGIHLDRVTSIQFTGATVEQKDFKQQSSELILLIVPDAAEKGFVTLKSSDGDIISKTQVNFGTVIVINSITAEARPGENVTISGNYLNWVDRVTFNRDKAVETFVSKSLTELVVKVPDDAQTGPLILHYQGTDSADVETEDTLYVKLPVASSLSPNPVKHQTNLTITGTDLDLTKKIWFSGVSAAVTNFVSQTATQLVVNVPAATTAGKITFEAASGVQTKSSDDLDVVLPVIDSITPGAADIGSDITIWGSNLDVVAGIAFVSVSNPVTSFVSQTPGKIVLTVPDSSLTGKLTFSVLNSILTVKSPSDLVINGSSVPPIIIYDDAITSAWTGSGGWIGGGWGGSKDLANTSPVKSGSYSCKIDYTSGGWGVPLQLGGANISLAGYTSLKVSIYGGAGSNGQSVNIGFNEADGKTITIVEGQWTDFTIPLNQISSAGTLTHLYMKNYSASGDFTIYFDDLGIY